MSEWLDNQRKPSSNFRKLLQERIEKANPRRKLTSEETKSLVSVVIPAYNKPEYINKIIESGL